MAELGWAGLTVAEDYGGAGLDWVDLAVLLEETGRGLLPSPLISHSLAATAISEFGNDEQKRAVSPLSPAERPSALSPFSKRAKS